MWNKIKSNLESFYTNKWIFQSEKLAEGSYREVNPGEQTEHLLALSKHVKGKKDTKLECSGLAGVEFNSAAPLKPIWRQAVTFPAHSDHHTTKLSTEKLIAE